jgi:hypothetical protein
MEAIYNKLARQLDKIPEGHPGTGSGVGKEKGDKCFNFFVCPPF